MKNKLLLAILLASILINFSSAHSIGIQFYDTSVTVPEGKTSCIGYGVYNLLEKDVTMTLTASEELQQFRPSADKVQVKAGTKHTEPEPINVCFHISKLYQSNCKIPGIVCERTCPQELKEISGTIVAHEVNSLSTTATAPLKLVIACESQSGMIGVVGLAIAILILGILSEAYISKKRAAEKPRRIFMEKYKQLQELHSRILRDPHNAELREEYNFLKWDLERLKRNL